MRGEAGADDCQPKDTGIMFVGLGFVDGKKRRGSEMMLKSVRSGNVQIRVVPALQQLLGGQPKELYYIGGSEVLPAPLSTERESELVDALVNCEDEQARGILIEHNLRLVVYIAKKFDNTGVGVEDLISIGTIGLIKAINTFKPEKKIKLATYASRCIENEILMYLRKSSNRHQESSIDEPLNTDGEGNELLLSDVLGTEQQVGSELEQDAEREMVRLAVNKLSKRERRIMELRFGLAGEKEHTQKEVADMIGISQSYISRLEKRIMKRLRVELEQTV